MDAASGMLFGVDIFEISVALIFKISVTICVVFHLNVCLCHVAVPNSLVSLRKTVQEVQDGQSNIDFSCF